MTQLEPVLSELISSPETIGANSIASGEGAGEWAGGGAVVCTGVTIAVGSTRECFVADQTTVRTSDRRGRVDGGGCHLHG